MSTTEIEDRIFLLESDEIGEELHITLLFWLLAFILFAVALALR